MKYFKWFIEWQQWDCRSRRFHLPVKEDPVKNARLTVLFPFCILFLIYFIIIDTLVFMWLSIARYSKNIKRINTYYQQIRNLEIECQELRWANEQFSIRFNKSHIIRRNDNRYGDIGRNLPDEIFCPGDIHKARELLSLLNDHFPSCDFLFLIDDDE